MHAPADFRVNVLRRLIVTPRPDLRFTPQRTGGQTCCIIEDPLHSKFYRIGEAEYVFISLLDGRTTLDEAIRRTASVLPEGGFRDEDAAAICQWLIDTKLAVPSEATRSAGRAGAASPGLADRLARWNPLMLRIPLGFPDRWLTRVTPWLAWLFAPPCVALWLLLVGVASYRVAANWDRFLTSSYGVFAPDQWLWLGAVWLVLKLWHEFAHALACKKYGGVVREAGLTLILLAPVAYVDVTSSWRFRSKWSRIFTAAAGIYAELFLGAVAAIVWSRTPPGPLNSLCLHATLMASVTTLACNANPLMRFDGYYILSDLLGIPNLASCGQQYLRYWGRRYLLGVEAALPTWPAGTGPVIRVYAVVALGWRIMVSVGLVVAAATLFHGAGIMLAIFAVASWCYVPLVRFTRYALRGRPGERRQWTRCVLIAGTAGGLLTLVLTAVPWPGATLAPAIVEFAPLTVVRSASAGFIKEVRVHGNQWVEPGDILIVLRNEERTVELADVELQVEQSRVKCRKLEQKQELAAFQAEQTTLQALEKHRDELRHELGELTIRASMRGKIIGRNLDALLGTYVDKGKELLSIGDDDAKELQLSIAQDDVDQFAGRRGREVTARLPGIGSFPATLTKLSPRAAVDPPHPAFCAPLGGPLAVAARSESKTESTEQYEFFAPRFRGSVELSRVQSQRLPSGQMGVVFFRAGQESIGRHLYHVSTRWLRERLSEPR